MAGMADQGQRLHRLAQAHIVGEDAAEAVAVHRGQPGESFLLVGAKFGVQGGKPGGAARHIGSQEAGVNRVVTVRG